jgi:hypothetical protein
MNEAAQPYPGCDKGMTAGIVAGVELASVTT